MPHCGRFGPVWAGACVLVLTTVLVGAAPSLVNGQAHDTGGKSYDEILDTYVRDGLVYYRALKLERGRFDAYIGTLAGVQIAAAPREEQIAFWLNAYNAIVLQTVIDHYPIPQRSAQYPQHSIR